MKIYRITLTIIAVIIAVNLSAQTDTTSFKPSGKIIAKAFMDYSTGLNSNTNEDTGFDITRAFLGYNYKITPTLEAQIIVDGAAGKDEKGNMQVYLRNAFIKWSDHGFSVSAGEIGLLAFSTQEYFWHHRYVQKTMQDLNGMIPSVDVGVAAEYEFNKIVSADITISNGEGYKKVKKDKSNRYSAGVTLHPFGNFTFRAYGDIYTESEKMRADLPDDATSSKYKDQYSFSIFGGYRDKNVSCGIEYNKLFNKGFIEDKDCYGYSAYSSVKIAPKWRVYARYDNTDSQIPAAFSSAWNNRNGQMMIGGIEFQPLKQLKISPNFRNINPDRTKSEQYIYINLEFNL